MHELIAENIINLNAVGAVITTGIIVALTLIRQVVR